MLLTEYIETCLIEKLDYNELNNVCIEDIVPVIPDSSNSYWCTKNIRRYKSAFMFYLDDQKDFYKESELHKDNKEIHKKWAGEPKDIKLKYKQYEEDDKKLVDKETNTFIQDFYDTMCKVPVTTYKLKFGEAYFGKLDNYPVFFSYNNRSHELLIFKENCIDKMITYAFAEIVNQYPCAADSSEYESYGPGGCSCEVCIDEALQTYISTKYSHLEKIIIPDYDSTYNLYHVSKLVKKEYF